MLRHQLPTLQRLLHLAEHILRGRRRGRPDTDVLEEAACATLERALDRCIHRAFGDHPRRVDSLRVAGAVSVLEHHVQIVRIAAEERDGKGLQSVLLRKLVARDAACRVVGIHLLVDELAVGGGCDGGRHLADGRRRIDEFCGQRIGRSVESERHRLVKCGQHSACALKAVDNLLRRARKVILKVAQPHIHAAAAVGLHVDEVLKVEHHVLVAITYKNVEVGVDHRRLIAPFHLERRRLNAVALVGLGLKLGVGGRVHHLGCHFAAAGHAILTQHILHLRAQRSQQRVAALGDVGANQQRLLQISQQVFGRGR